MATIEEALRAVVVADATVAALVGTRVYPMGATQLTNLDQVMVGYAKIAGGPVYDHAGENGIGEGRWMFQAQAPTYAQARTLANAVKHALSAYQGTSSGIPIRMVHCVSDEDVTDPEVQQQVVAVDFRVLYYEGTL